MWLRVRADNPLRDGGEYRTTYGGGNTEERRTGLDPAVLHDGDFRFFLQLRDPEITGISPSSEGRNSLSLTARDGSWTRTDIATPGDVTVSQTGRHRIWDHIETAAEHWARLGRPTHDRLGLTATTSGACRLWLDSPDVVCWELSGGTD